MFDPQVPFDPTKEQLDAPPQTINRGHCQRRDFGMIGQKDQVPSRLGIEAMHLPQPCYSAGRTCDAGSGTVSPGGVAGELRQAARSQGAPSLPAPRALSQGFESSRQP